jgi:hypothetical protein
MSASLRFIDPTSRLNFDRLKRTGHPRRKGHGLTDALLCRLAILIHRPVSLPSGLGDLVKTNSWRNFDSLTRSHQQDLKWSGTSVLVARAVH